VDRRAIARSVGEEDAHAGVLDWAVQAAYREAKVGVLRRGAAGDKQFAPIPEVLFRKRLHYVGISDGAETKRLRRCDGNETGGAECERDDGGRKDRASAKRHGTPTPQRYQRSLKDHQTDFRACDVH
jgi:hypothetical protein